MLPKDSLKIACIEAVKYLKELGDQAYINEDEIQKILSASFIALRRGESDKENLYRGIIQIIDNAASRIQSDSNEESR